MTLRTSHRTRGMRQARRVLKRLEDIGEDPRELQEAIGQTMVESAVQRLAVTNRGPDGTPWPQSARAKHDGGRTQHDTGQAGLAGSLTYRALPGAIEVGSPLIYAAQRQFGGTIRAKPGKSLAFPERDETGRPVIGNDGQPRLVFVKSVTQPARPYLGISDEDADEIGSLALEFLEQVMPRDGGARP